MIPEMFQYEQPNVPEDAIAVLSPSQIAKFFEYPRVWYEENLLGNSPEFKGNTSTITGTICHYIYEMVTKGIKVDKLQIEEDLKIYLADNPNPDINMNQVLSNYIPVVEVVVNQYILDHNKHAYNVEVEQKVCVPLGDDIYLAGTYDRLEDDILCDYKTVATKPNEFVIPFHYKIQLLSYAYALRKMGKEVNAIRIIYGIKPTKTIAARCIVVTETIDEASWKLVEDTLQLICESIKLVREKPELTHIVFKSMDLKKDK